MLIDCITRFLYLIFSWFYGWARQNCYKTLELLLVFDGVFKLRKELISVHYIEELDSSVSCTTCRVHIRLWKELLNPPTPETIFKNLSTVPLGSWSSNPLEFLRVLFLLLKYGIFPIFGFFNSVQLLYEQNLSNFYCA